MNLINNIEKFTGLRRESSDLSVAPPSHNALAIGHKLNAVCILEALHLRLNLDVEQLRLIDRAEDLDLILAEAGEHVGVVVRKDHPHNRHVADRAHKLLNVVQVGSLSLDPVQSSLSRQRVDLL